MFNHQTDLIFVRNYLLEWAFPKGENGQVRQEVIALATPAVVEAHLGLLSACLGNKTYWVGEGFKPCRSIVIAHAGLFVGATGGPQLFAPAENLSHYTQSLRQRPSSSKILQAKPKG